MKAKKNQQTRLNTNAAIIIPVYNEAKVIKAVCSEVTKKFKYVICVNDGSSDESSLEISQTNAYLIEHPINMGQGAAIQTGIEFARQLPIDYFVTFDADGQHRLEDVQEMLKTIKKQQCDIVLGSRFLGKTVGIKRAKYIILKCAIKFSNALSGLTLTDTHNGLRVFNRVVADGMRITLPDMAHASEIIDIVAARKYKYVEIPVTIKYTDYSLSKGQSIINAVNISFDMLLRKIAK